LLFYWFMETTEGIDLLDALVLLATIVFIIATGVVLLNQQFQKKLMQQRLKKEELENHHQQELLRTSIEVQENERKRIAQDLHDDLGAALSIGKMQLIQLETKAKEEHQPLQEGLMEVRQLVANAMTATRRISHSLMPAELVNLGLDKTLKNKARQLSEVGLKVQVMTEKAEMLSWSTQLGLYRIYSELLNNTLKHAEATEAIIKMEIEDAELIFWYEDNGIGLQLDFNNSGLGLKNLEARAKAMNSSLKIGNKTAGGFLAEIRLPASCIINNDP